MLTFKEQFFISRRWVLKKIIPEFFWPKYINVDNVPFKIRGTPYSFGTKLEIVRGLYELPERRLIRNKIKKGDVIIEMGGSIGVLTTLISQMTGPSGFVVSIEASSKLVEYSKFLLEKDNVKIVHGFAFPVFKLKKSIIVNDFDESGGSLGGKVKFNEVNNQFSNDDSKIFDIDKISSFFQITPTVLIIDIEGSEKIILSQCPNFPKTIRTIIIELHPNLYTEEEKIKIIQKILDDGFVIELIDSTSYLFTR
jgi:FkbM family methyltransferase